jgi:hypothetical protein
MIDQSPLATAIRLAQTFSVPTEVLDQLRRLHQVQWELEDETRRRDATPGAITTAKGRIDACNAIRHRLIDAMDAAVEDITMAAMPRLYSETIGELCDRLLILDLKQRALARTSSSEADQVSRVCAHLAQLADQLVTDRAAGRAGLPPRAGVKVYAADQPASTQAVLR